MKNDKVKEKTKKPVENKHSLFDFINPFGVYMITEKLSTSEVSVYLYLMMRVNWNFWRANTMISTKTACQELRISRPTFIKVRTELKKLNLISFVEGTMYQPPSYNLTNPDEWIKNNLVKNFSKNFTFNNTQNRGVKNFTGGVKNFTGGVKKLYTCKDISKTEKDCFKKYNQQVDYIKKIDFFKKNTNNYFFQTATTDLFRSVNNQEEKRKKVAPKKEKRFFNEKKHLKHETPSLGGVMPKNNKSTLNRIKSPLKFIPLADEQIRMYILERGNKISANDFIAYYFKKGWKISKHWHVLVKEWERNQRKKKVKQQQSSSLTFPCRQVVGGVQLSFYQNAVSNELAQQTNAVSNELAQQTNAVSNELAQQTNAVSNEKPAKPKLNNVFQIPTQQEIIDIFKQRKNDLDPVFFYQYYQDKEWKINGRKMKNLLLTIMNWERNELRWGKPKPKTYVENKKNTEKEPTIGRTPISVIKQNLTGWEI